MRVVLFANNWVGLEIARSLRRSGEQIVAVVVHKPERARFREEIVEACGVPASSVIEGPSLRQPAALAAIATLQPDLGVSAYFGHILRPPLIALFRSGVINVHPALLPYNRGAYPNVWSLVDRTPAGVTIHYIDAGVDTGDLIAQREVEKEPVDTGASLYRKLELAAVALFEDSWPAIRSGDAPRRSQPVGFGTHHRQADVDAIDCIDLARYYRADEILDLLRARTFSEFPSAYFVHGGRKVFVRVSLAYDEKAEGARNEDR